MPPFAILHLFQQYFSLSERWADDNESVCNGTPFTLDIASSGARARDRYISTPALNPLSYRDSSSVRT